jgi:recombination associated protein RdgC
MFKNLTVYALPEACRFHGGLPLNLKLEALPFRPCGPTEPESWGFVTPHAHANGLSAPLGDGRTVLCVRRQQRKVPAETLRKRVDELAKTFEQETGRKAGAKRRRELKDEAMLELLPQAFTKDTTALVLIECHRDRLVIESTSNGMLDGVLTTLVKAIPGFAPMPWNTVDSPASWMARLLIEGENPSAFQLGRSLELCSSDAQERRVAWRNADLLSSDVQENLDAGAAVVRLALDFSARTELTLTEYGQLKGLLMDLAAMAQPQGDAEGWRTDAELVTAELACILDELEDELGGRMAPLGVEA